LGKEYQSLLIGEVKEPIRVQLKDNIYYGILTPDFDDKEVRRKNRREPCPIKIENLPDYRTEDNPQYVQEL
jgi:hypothetical protein